MIRYILHPDVFLSEVVRAYGIGWFLYILTGLAFGSMGAFRPVCGPLIYG
jgi:hypothetical protein